MHMKIVHGSKLHSCYSPKNNVPTYDIFEYVVKVSLFPRELRYYRVKYVQFIFFVLGQFGLFDLG